MKILKFNESVTEPEVLDLFKQLKYHDQMHRKVDKQLADICTSKISDLLKNGEGEKAKKVWWDFYTTLSSEICT